MNLHRSSQSAISLSLPGGKKYRGATLEMARVGGCIKPKFVGEDACWGSGGGGDPAGGAMLLKILRREPPRGETLCCGRRSCS